MKTGSKHTCLSFGHSSSDSKSTEMKSCLNLFAFVLTVAVLSDAAKLPSNWKTCKRNDPNLNSCLKKVIQPAIDQLAKKGFSKLGIFPIDPLYVEELELISGGTTITLDLIFRKLNMYGFKDMRVDEVSADFNNKKMIFKVSLLSPLRLEGEYSINGKLLIVPIKGSGLTTIILDSITALATVDFEETKSNDGKSYWRSKEFEFKFDYKKVSMNFRSADGVANTINTIVNENADGILKDLKPSISDAFGQAFGQITNRIFTKVPINDILPE